MRTPIRLAARGRYGLWKTRYPAVQQEWYICSIRCVGHCIVGRTRLHVTYCAIPSLLSAYSCAHGRRSRACPDLGRPSPASRRAQRRRGSLPAGAPRACSPSRCASPAPRARHAPCHDRHARGAAAAWIPCHGPPAAPCCPSPVPSSGSHQPRLTGCRGAVGRRRALHWRPGGSR